MGTDGGPVAKATVYLNLHGFQKCVGTCPREALALTAGNDGAFSPCARVDAAIPPTPGSRRARTMGRP